MAPKWLAKTKYGAKPKPKATAPPPSPPSRAPEAPHAAPIPAMAPADRGAPPSAPPQATHQPPPGGVDFVMIPPQPSAQLPPLRAPEPQQSAPVPAMAPVDWGARHGAPPSSPGMRAPEPQQSAAVPAMAPADRGAQQGAQPSAPRMRAPEPQQSAPVPAMAPVDSGAPQGAQPSAPAMRAPEPQQSGPVRAMAPAHRGAPQGAQPSAPQMRASEPQQSAPVPPMAAANSGARQGAQPSAPPMRAAEPQQSIPIKALPTAASGAPQGGRPSAQPLCAAELQHSMPVPGMAPVDSGAPQGAQPSSQPPCAAPPQQPTLLPTSATLNNMDYGPDNNLVEGFTQRWLDRDGFVTKASEVYTVHDMEAAEVWANKNGTKRNPAFEQWWPRDDGEGDGNAPPQPQWASQMEVWGNYELSHGDILYGWISANPNWDAHNPDFEARVHGDGISGQRVWISRANMPHANLIGNYWCKVVPDTSAFRTLRREIQHGAAWPKLLANMRAEPRDTPPLSSEDQDILKHLVKQHALNPSQALVVRQVLDDSCIIALTGGAGTGKSETMVACIKAVLWQQGLLVAQNPDPADLGTFNMGRKVGGPERDTQPRACVLVTAPTNAQVDMLLARVHKECYKDSVFREKVLREHSAPWLRLRAQRATAPPGLAPFDHEKVQQTLGRTPGCKATLKCALNSCRVLFATAGMVANRHKMLLGKGQEKTRFAFNFVDEASRNSIPTGLDLAAMGSQFMLCGDPGQLRPYSHVQLLASACEAEKAEVVPEAVAPSG